MKTIFKIHPFFYFFAIICIFTGYFRNFIYITFIILFHELGHIISARYFKWYIDKIILLPFGGITIFNEKINKPIIEEFVITIMGPLFQLLLLNINDDLFINYNLNLLIFNLLPILPLDGSKILNLILNKIFSFKLSHLISIYISIISIIILIKLKYSLIIYITLIFLISKTYKEYHMHNYIFNKFLFERYLYNLNFSKRKIIKKVSQMKRDYSHTIKYENKYISEKSFLLKLFDN